MESTVTPVEFLEPVARHLLSSARAVGVRFPSAWKAVCMQRGGSKILQSPATRRLFKRVLPYSVACGLLKTCNTTPEQACWDVWRSTGFTWVADAWRPQVCFREKRNLFSPLFISDSIVRPSICLFARASAFWPTFGPFPTLGVALLGVKLTFMCSSPCLPRSHPAILVVTSSGLFFISSFHKMRQQKEMILGVCPSIPHHFRCALPSPASPSPSPRPTPPGPSATPPPSPPLLQCP